MTLDGTGRAVGPCPIGTCQPVDICAVCRCIVTASGARGWHADNLPHDHDAAPIVICAWCGAEAEAVTPAELAEAWGATLADRPVEGQTSWVE